MIRGNKRAQLGFVSYGSVSPAVGVVCAEHYYNYVRSEIDAVGVLLLIGVLQRRTAEARNGRAVKTEITNVVAAAKLLGKVDGVGFVMPAVTVGYAVAHRRNLDCVGVGKLRRGAYGYLRSPRLQSKILTRFGIDRRIVFDSAVDNGIAAERNLLSVDINVN